MVIIGGGHGLQSLEQFRHVAGDLAGQQLRQGRQGAANSHDVGIAEPGWRVDTIAAISIEKALPLLRSWSAPLSGLVAARWPEAPEITRDLELLAAVRTVRAVFGSDGRRDRASITVNLRDLP